MIRFWSETGGRAGGGEVRSQPRLGDGRLNSATPFSRWVGGLQAPVLRHGVRVLTEMLSQTKCLFAVCMSLRGQEVGGLIPAGNWGSVTHFSINFVKCQSLGQVLLFVLWCDLQKITSFELLFPVLFCVRQGSPGGLKVSADQPLCHGCKAGGESSLLSPSQRGDTEAQQEILAELILQSGS